MMLMAAVMVAAAVLAGAYFLTKGPKTDVQRTAGSAYDMREVRNAVLAHLTINNGSLCPDTAPTPTGNAADTCATPRGVVPWLTVGLPRSKVIDPWGNYLTLVVDDSATVDEGEAGACSFLLISHGANGFGAKRTTGSGTNDDDGSNDSNEQSNADEDNTTNFYSVGTTASPSTERSTFDDIVICGAISNDGDEETQTSDNADSGNSFNDKLTKRIYEGYYDGFRTTTDTSGSGGKAIEPKQETAADGATVFAFSGGYYYDTNFASDLRSCLWSRTAMPLESYVQRSYFEVSFSYDTTDSLKYGMTYALLPWEVTVNNTRCGKEGAFLGFANTSHSDDYSLIKSSDFTTGLSNYTEAMPFGLELDVSSTTGAISGVTFADPTTPTASRNHIAIVEDNNFHNASPPNSTIQANPACSSTADAEACVWKSGGGNNWLELGTANYNKVRLEIEDGPVAGSCGEGEVEVRAWVWPSNVSCAGSCANLDAAYTTSDSGAIKVARCLTKPTRTLNMKNGWEPASWALVRSGFTIGLSGTIAQRAQTRIKNYALKSFPKVAEPATASNTAKSSEISVTSLAPYAGMNWAALEKAGGSQSNGWTTVAWLDFPDLGVSIHANQGEITIVDNTQNGMGIKGIGGPSDEYYAPLLDNTADATERGAPGTEEALAFRFDKYYSRAKVMLTGFTGSGTSAEKARIYLLDTFNSTYQSVDVSASTCNWASDVFINVTGTGAKFDTVRIEPLPTTGNAASGFYVRAVRACGSGVSATDCAITEQRWVSSCTLTATAN